MNGEERVIANLHGVATHPEHRRRGFFRALMDEALAWCEARYPAQQLCTDNPEYFEPFGFRVVPEHRFRAAAPPSRGNAPVTERLRDRRTLHRLLASREPVSSLFGSRDRQVFLFNQARSPLYYASDLDAVFVWEVEGDALRIDDVVAETMPPLDEIAARAPGAFQRVELAFAPDRVAAETTPIPEPLDEDVLMVRGPYPVEGALFKLPPSARC